MVFFLGGVNEARQACLAIKSLIILAMLALSSEARAEYSGHYP
jgi:hypothetical protein